jgi:hypothetical protein
MGSAATKKRRGAPLPHNAVRDAVDKVGCLIQAAAIMRVSVESVRRQWCIKGEVRLAKAAVLLSWASGTPLEKLIGLE